MALNFTNGIAPEIRFECRHGNIKNFISPSEIRLCLGGRDPAVSVGSDVKIGQPLTKGDMPLYSGISGTVTFLGDECITVGNDFEGTLYDGLKMADKPLQEYAPTEIYEMLRMYGIRDSFDGKPLCDKLLSCRQAKRIIVNCAETDFKSDAVSRMISENTQALAGGAKILAKALGVPKAVFVCTDNNRELIKLLREIFADESAFVTAVIKQKYPIIPSTIFSALYGRHIPNLSRPEDIGYLMISAESVIQTYSSFITGVPQVYKVLSLVGECMKNKVNVRAPIGADITEMIDHFGGVGGKKVELLTGSIFERNKRSENMTVGYDTNQILAVRSVQIKADKCIRCGECLSACPMLLNPMRYALLHEARQPHGKYNYTEQCIGCGCCEFVCPSNIPLISIITGERDIRNCKEATQ